MIRNANIVLAITLFAIGILFLSLEKYSTLSGALFGAGAALLGSWTTDISNRRSNALEKMQREKDAQRYLAAELNRTIERILYIHQRAIPNFTSASAEYQIKPNDRREDFVPYMPILYPHAPQFRDLPADDAAALIGFYDSLHVLEKIVFDWWEREGQLSVNIFNGILNAAGNSLSLAAICIQRFNLDTLYPPQYESWGPLSSRLIKSQENAEQALAIHLKRFESKANPQ